MNNIIMIRNLSKSFKDNKIFENLNLDIPKNKITTVYGPSGCGKSTLLNIIGLIENYNSGYIVFEGEKIPKISSVNATKWKRNKISYIFQNFGLLQNSTINDNLNIGTKFLKKDKKEIKKMKLEVMKKVGLNYKLSTKTYELSGGEQQRVSIARALLKPSDVILADEPTGSLDYNNKKVVLDLLRSIKNKTIIIVSHDEYLKKYSDKVINL